MSDRGCPQNVREFYGLRQPLLLGVSFPYSVFNTDIFSAKGDRPAFFLLPFIMAERFYSNVSQKENDDDIDDGHESHGDIGQVPHQGKIRLCPQENSHNTGDAENIQQNLVVLDEQDVGFCIKVIADEAAKGESKDGECNKMDSPASHVGADGCLDIRDAVHNAAFPLDTGN